MKYQPKFREPRNKEETIIDMKIAIQHVFKIIKDHLGVSMDET